MALRSTPLQESAAPTYEEYVAARWTSLYRTAYLLTANHADAEDLAQTTLVKVYLAWARITAAESPDAYVRRILTNEFLSSRRPLRITREHLVDQAPDFATTGPPGPDDRLLLWPHIATLPPRQRAVIVLRYYEDLTEQQIAEILGCAPGTVKSTASDALRSLRTRINQPEGEPS